MSAGTITLTNNSTAVTGSGTAFTTDLKSGDFITATVGGILYTLPVETVTSNTAVVLTSAYTGPTQAGAAWVAIPRKTMNQLTADLVAQATQAIRGLNNDKQNWQQFYSAPGDITVNLPDGTAVSGPSWPKMAGLTNGAIQWRGNIAANSNINNFGPTSAYTGAWGQSSVSISAADLANGYPVAERGVLEVHPGGQNNCTQTYRTASGRFYIRTLAASWNASSPSWSDWFQAGGLSQVVGLPADATSLTDPKYFSQSVTYSTSGANSEFPSGINTAATVLVSFRRGASVLGINQLLFTVNGTFERHGQTNANTNWTSVSWYAGGDANGWRLVGADAMAAVGIGVATQPTVSAFDWQQADFVVGQNQQVNVTGWLNAPAGLLNVAGDVVNIICDGARTANSRWTIRIVSQAFVASSRYDYHVTVNGAKGSRTFSVTQMFNSDPSTVVPIANGGTGEKTAAGARNAISAAVGGVTVSGAFSNIISVDPGFYSINGGNFSDPANGDFGSLFSAGTYGSGLNGQIFIRNDGTSLLYRGGSNATVRTVYSTANTTVDSNGFIKKSSPVINIFSDGRCINNDESEGVTVTRQAEGVYLLEGCIGLNSDASWGGPDGGFEIPLDRNKQPRIWLDYEVNPDGSVLVKTYHRTYPDSPAFARNEIEGVANGDPIDIPADQFVSVRVEMPADSIYNKRMEEAARVQAIRDEERRIAEEEAARLKAEEEAKEAEEADFEDVDPDVTE